MSEKFDSTADERTQNNTMRQQYRTLSEEEKQQMADLKELGQQFVDLCDQIGESRELSLGKTKAEEAVMRACKHVTA